MIDTMAALKSNRLFKEFVNKCSINRLKDIEEILYVLQMIDNKYIDALKIVRRRILELS